MQAKKYYYFSKTLSNEVREIYYYYNDEVLLMSYSVDYGNGFDDYDTHFNDLGNENVKRKLLDILLDLLNEYKSNI